MLFCVICINKTESTVSWVLRVAVRSLGEMVDLWTQLTFLQPAVAILHTIYAVYHLCRSSKARTPASSASYMLFAAVIDAGLIPFFVVTALMARTEYIEPNDTQGRWQTLFNTDITNDKIFYATFLLSVVDGGLYLISLVISIYLTVIFRKICKLPPDANPLEDNLTSRAHKRNKSSIGDNHTSQTSPATANSKQHSSAGDPLISPTRNIPLMHTRTESTSNLHNTSRSHFSPHDSRTDISIPFGGEPRSERTSRVNTFRSPSRPRSFYEQSSSKRSTYTDVYGYSNEPAGLYEQPSSKRSSAPDIPRAPTMSPSVYTDFSRPTSTRPPSTRPTSTRPAPVAPPAPSPDENWISHPSPPGSPPVEFQHLRTLNEKDYAPVPQTAPAWNTENFNPLELNPPTPPNYERRQMPQQRPLTQGTGNSLGFGVGKLRDYDGLRRGYVGGHRVVSSGRDSVEKPVNGVRTRGVSGKMAEQGMRGEWFARSD